MKLMTALNLVIFGFIAHPAHAVKVQRDAAARLTAVCLAQVGAAKASGELHLNPTPQEFCECVAGNHVLNARDSLSATEAAKYLDEVTSFYRPLSKSESAQARAAFKLTDDSDMEIAEKCDAK